MAEVSFRVGHFSAPNMAAKVPLFKRRNLRFNNGLIDTRK